MFKGRKIPHLELVPILLIAFILYRIVNNIELFASWLGFLFSVLSYFIWGFAIAYLLNPAMVHLEKKYKFKRLWSLLLVYLSVLVIIAFAITFISPGVARSIRELSANIPLYISETVKWFNKTVASSKVLEKYGVISYLEKNLAPITVQANRILNSSLSIIVENTISVTSTVLKFIFGLVVSVYLLKDKEALTGSLKSLIYAILNRDRADRFMNFGREVNAIFSSFVVGKTIDSLIIGILCFIGLSLMNAPYSLLLSLIVGITNMIPYFGPFIGMIPAGLITLFIDPIKALWVLLFILILQQFDGWVLGPKILGDKVGLSAFWVIMAITIGGRLFGLLGMFLGVPTMAVIKMLLKRYINGKLESKKIDI